MADAYYAVLQHLPPGQNTSFRREHYEWSLGYRKECNSPDMMDDGRRGCIDFYLTRHTQELQAKLEVVSSASSPVQAATRSSVEDLVPKDFDNAHAYRTYSVDELRAAMTDASETNKVFVGQRIKVFAKYESNVYARSVQFAVNRTRMPIPSFGCQIGICDSMEPIMDPFGVVADIGVVFSSLYLQAHFRDAAKYQQFLSDANKQCSYMYPCPQWIKGRLGHVSAKVRRVGVPFDARIVYLDVD